MLNMFNGKETDYAGYSIGTRTGKQAGKTGQEDGTQ
jgi:hypothetical protein